MKYFFLLALVCFTNVLLAQSNPNEVGPYPTQDSAIAISTDSVLRVIQKYSLSKNNNYIASEQGFLNILRSQGKFNEILVFNSSGAKLKLYEGVKCSNNSMILRNLEFNSLKEDRRVSLNTILSECTAITEKKVNEAYPNIVIFWGMTTGIKTDDNSLEWESIINERFKNKINIFKINMDVSSSWSAEVQESRISFLNRLLIKIKASMN